MNFVEKDLFYGVIGHYEANQTVLIPHITNNVKAWGAGFVIPLAKHFPEARSAFYTIENPVLGHTQFVEAANVPAIICNMFAQEGIGKDAEGNPPIRYDALKKCMTQVNEKANQLKAEGKQVVIATPLFGVGLAGGDWGIISEMMAEIWIDQEVNVYFLPALLPSSLKAIKVGEQNLVVHRYSTEEQANV